MENELNWFNDELGYGYIEYRENGDVLIRICNGENIKEYELIKNGEQYNLKDRI